MYLHKFVSITANNGFLTCSWSIRPRWSRLCAESWGCYSHTLLCLFTHPTSSAWQWWISRSQHCPATGFLQCGVPPSGLVSVQSRFVDSEEKRLRHWHFHLVLYKEATPHLFSLCCSARRGPSRLCTNLSPFFNARGMGTNCVDDDDGKGFRPHQLRPRGVAKLARITRTTGQKQIERIEFGCALWRATWNWGQLLIQFTSTVCFYIKNCLDKTQAWRAPAVLCCQKCDEANTEKARE